MLRPTELRDAGVDVSRCQEAQPTELQAVALLAPPSWWFRNSLQTQYFRPLPLKFTFEILTPQ